MRPSVVCLCGSTRFTDEMLIWQWELNKKGCIVLSWCALPSWYPRPTGDQNHVGDQENVKAAVDELHKRKIDLCDEVHVIDVGQYAGESTSSEITYAIYAGKQVAYVGDHVAALCQELALKATSTQKAERELALLRLRHAALQAENEGKAETLATLSNELTATHEALERLRDEH